MYTVSILLDIMEQLVGSRLTFYVLRGFSFKVIGFIFMCDDSGR